MRRQNLFAKKKSRIATWLKVTALFSGIGTLGIVIAKVSLPTDPALDRQVELSISAAIAPPEAPLAQRDATLLDRSPGALTAETDTPRAVTAEAHIEPNPDTTRTVRVQSGDSLSVIFSRLGLSAQEASNVIALGDQAAPLEKMRPGDTLDILISADQSLKSINYQIAPNQSLSIQRDADNQLTANQIVLPVETRLATAEGHIDSSLYQSAIDAGLSANMVLQLADIFGWKINFLKDVQNGDHFRLVYEEKFVQGKRVQTGNVMAAEFTNAGKVFQAVRYTTPEGKAGYYEPNGASLGRGFLRYPVEFSRISSKFSLARLHPIYDRIKPHKGVDFAAPTGTPIHAAGAGKVEFVGWQHGYGKVVKIKHDGGYETVYGHMSRFNDALKKGSTVAMGQTIGFVGMTGDATGPHLHYEFHVKGVYTDPLIAKMPEANPIPSKYRKDFLAQTQSVLDLMAQNSQATPLNAANASALVTND
ncbi:MAG TPA: peptidoglycan DD-metalloendopeptidase family protein [Halothiobacillus sp.]|nr:peptidoglycan DD-metalloendopeptidase family protein [Halothiobacillus sp.]